MKALLGSAIALAFLLGSSSSVPAQLIAYDKASNVPYADGWDDTIDDGGFGYQGWLLNPIANNPNAGHLISDGNDGSAVEVDARSFHLYSNTALSSAQRDIDFGDNGSIDSLDPAAFHTFIVRMDFGTVATDGGGMGVSLTNFPFTRFFEFQLEDPPGGGDDADRYVVFNDSSVPVLTMIPTTETVLRLEFTFQTSNGGEILLIAKRDSDGSQLYDEVFEVPDNDDFNRLFFFNNGGGASPGGDFFFNEMMVIPEPTATAAAILFGWLCRRQRSTRRK